MTFLVVNFQVARANSVWILDSGERLAMTLPCLLVAFLVTSFSLSLNLDLDGVGGEPEVGETTSRPFCPERNVHPPADPQVEELPEVPLVEGVWVSLVPKSKLRSGEKCAVAGLPLELYVIKTVHPASSPSAEKWYWVSGKDSGWVLESEILGQDETIITLNKVIAVKPKESCLYEQRGRLELGKSHSSTVAGLRDLAEQQLSQAIADFTKAIQLDDKSAEAYRQRGLCRGLRGELTQAWADLTLAIDLLRKAGTSNGLAACLIQRASVFRLRGVEFRDDSQFEKSLDDLNDALRLEPRNAEAHQELLSTLGERDRLAGKGETTGESEHHAVLESMHGQPDPETPVQPTETGSPFVSEPR